jgi:hypothetical protein
MGGTMPTLRVRYRTGDTDDWTLHEQQDVEDLAKRLFLALRDRSILGFSVATELGHERTDYGWVSVRMEDVVSCHVDGLLDFPGDLAVVPPEPEA